MAHVDSQHARILEFPGDRTEAEWLDAFEFLRKSLSESLNTTAQLGVYRIDDFPRSMNAGGCARVRGSGPIAGLDSNYWEGIVGWSGSRGQSGHAGASIFPFRDGSVLQQRGRLADLSADAEANDLLSYRFENGRFLCDGWTHGDGPGEWAGVAHPNSIYLQVLEVINPVDTFVAGQPIVVEFRLPEPVSAGDFEGARLSLVHVNRNCENTNLVPWTARPPHSDSQHAPALSKNSLTSSRTVAVRLDALPIRGDWIPGRYYLSLRIQNLHDPNDWSFTCNISPPIKFTIVD